MKNLKFFPLLAMLAMILTACPEPINPPEPPDPDNPQDSTVSTLDDPWTVAEAQQNQGKTGYVKGVIVGYYCYGADNQWIAGADTCTQRTNILIQDEAGELVYDMYMPVQLPTGDVRNALNLVDNKDNIGKTVIVYGDLTSYCGLDGIKNVSYAVLDGTEYGQKPGVEIETEGEGTKASPYTVADVNKLSGKVSGKFFVKGFIVGQIKADEMTYDESTAEFTAPFVGNANGYNTNILIGATADVNTVAEAMPVQLPSGDVRLNLNLPENPDMYQKEVILYGSIEPYFKVAGVKDVTYAIVGEETFGIEPVDVKNALLDEPLNNQTSFDKFTTYSVKGDEEWVMDTQYGAKMSGYTNNASHENEDWLITPALDLTGREAKVVFEHARGPESSITVGVDEGWYSVWVSNDYTEGDPTVATWTEITGVTHGTQKWTYVSSGELSVPAENCKANARIAFKYICSDSESATWEIRNLKVY